MRNKHSGSMDGFVPRRAARNLGEEPSKARTNLMGLEESTPRRSISSKPDNAGRTIGGISRSDIDDSLGGIDDQTPEKPRKRGIFGRKKGPKKPISRRKKIIKRVIIAIILILLAIGVFIGIRALIAAGNVFQGDIIGLLQSKPLKEDENGRSNILVLGTSEDDPGHEAGYLTDSMMIVSIDQHKKNAVMFSIPRDLYVQYGRSCAAGTEGKINAYFSCVSDGKSKEAEEQRLSETRKFVGDIFGMDLQYATHVNNTVIKDAVDAVGGVDVDIQGNGPTPYGVKQGSILDRNFDWRCKYKCNLVKYSPGVHHLDGKHALFLSMARGDTAPTYGLADSNFDREKNQQKIIIALKKQAVSSGTLTDFTKVSKLIDAFGDNLRTNFDTSEIRTLMKLGKDIPTDSIKRLDLFDRDNPVVTTGDYAGQSVVMPKAGIFDYSEIRSFLNKKLSKNPVVREGAHIAVYNGTETAGLGQVKADALEEQGYTVTYVGNPPDGTYSGVTIYQLSKDTPETAKKLADKFGVTIKKTDPPMNVSDDTDFVIIFGKESTSGNSSAE